MYEFQGSLPVHKNPRPVLILSDMNPLNILPFHLPRSWNLSFQVFQLNLCILLSLRSRYMPCPPYSPCFYYPKSIWWTEQIMKISWSDILHLPVTSTSLVNSVMSALFSVAWICISFKVRDKVLHPYKTANKITVLCILFSSFFLDRKTTNSQC